MPLAPLLDLAPLRDARGSLVAIESERSVPFAIRRVYYLYDWKEARGAHAHRELVQVYICVSGRCTVTLDDGRSREKVSLADPGQGLLIGRMIWRELNDFSQDCVLLVLASDHFAEEDYIRDHDDFVAAVAEARNG